MNEYVYINIAPIRPSHQRR